MSTELKKQHFEPAGPGYLGKLSEKLFLNSHGYKNVQVLP
jgi:hypothetical protein